MPRRVVVVDTSVLCNVLRIPGMGNASDFDADFKTLEGHVQAGVQLVLPLATIIETGNFVAQSTGDRHRYIEQFVKFLDATVSGRAPWVASGHATTSALVEQMLTATPSSLKDHLGARIGTGDASILAEVARLRHAFGGGTTVEVWTRDSQLGAYANQ